MCFYYDYDDNDVSALSIVLCNNKMPICHCTPRLMQFLAFLLHIYQLLILINNNMYSVEVKKCMVPWSATSFRSAHLHFRCQLFLLYDDISTKGAKMTLNNYLSIQNLWEIISTDIILYSYEYSNT